MTREELVSHLNAWPPAVRWSSDRLKRRDELQFAAWWYGRSTEADKPNPSWPDDDYVASKTGGGPRYLESIDAALSLVPPGWAWSIQRSESCGAAAWLYPPDNTEDLQIHVKHWSAPIAVCMAAIQARFVTPTPAY